MESSFVTAGRSVIPVMLLILLGMLLRRVRWISTNGADALDKLSFRLLLPLALFRSIYEADFRSAFDARLVVIALSLSLLTFALAVGLSALKEKDPPRRASLAQGIFRNNCLVFGLPMMSMIYGAEEIGMFSMILAFVIPVNNVLAVLLLSWLTSRKVTVGGLLKRLITNPYVAFAIAGFLVKLSGIRLPEPGMKVISDLAAASSPLALLGLGAGLRFASFRQDRGSVLFGSFARLMLGPLLLLPLVALTGVRGAPMTAMFFLIGSPTAVASYTMAKEMGADSDLAAHLVVAQSLLCCGSIFLFLSVMGLLGWI